MLRPSVASGVLCLVLAAAVAADEPKKVDKNTVPISKEKLLGKWEGPKDVPITLVFTEKKVEVTVITTKDRVRKSMTVEWDYEIDVKKNYARLHPFDFEEGTSYGSVVLKADGTLTLGLDALPPFQPKWLEDVSFTKVKPKDPRK